MNSLRRLSIALALLTAGSLALTAAPASAIAIHTFGTSFGAAATTPADPYPLSDPIGVAVNNSSTGSSAGDVYVADPANHWVEKFNAEGSFLLVIGKDVNQTTGGNLCTAESLNICQEGSPGSSPGAFQTPAFVAVDGSSGASAGDLYVADTADNLVSKFTPEGALIESWGTQGQLGGFTAIAGIATDASGNLFVYDSAKNSMFEFAPDGTPDPTVPVGRTTTPVGIAVDSAHDFYKVLLPSKTGEALLEFDSAGKELGEPDAEENVTGLAADLSTNDLYVDQGGASINRFASSCDPSEGRCTPTEAFGGGHLAGAKGLAVNASSATVYVANPGAEDVLSFPEVTVPTLTTGSASNILTGKSPSATLSGHLVPDGGPVTACYFEVRGEQVYEETVRKPPEIEEEVRHLDERTVPCTPAPPYSSETNVSAQISGLLLGTKYHYRLVASDSDGSSYGQDQTFRVPGLPINMFSARSSTSQAGGHPDVTTTIFWNERQALNYPTDCFCQDAENITTHLPPGLIGNPHAVPYCTPTKLDEHACPSDSQVGTIETYFISGNSGQFLSPVFNIEPDPDQAGLLGFYFPFTGSQGLIELSARTGGDFGLDATIKGIEHVAPPNGSELTLWGVPADPSHDAERGTPSSSPRIPFLDNPTVCGESLTTTLEMLAYDEGISFAESSYPATTGCDQLSFNPSLSAQPTTAATDTPSGLEVDLSVPQEESPNTPSPSEIRATTVKLPPGFSINPAAADGKSACTDAEARLGTPEEAQCPETSKVGTVSLNSSALPGTIPGFVYLLAPQPGNRYRILLSANGFATHVKLLGSITPDPNTGQLTTSFPNLPQSPFTDFNIHFFGSERGLLATPTQCGKYPVQSTFTPWDSALPEQSATQFFNVTSGPSAAPCPGSTRPFNPGFQASTVNGSAAAHSPFSIELARPDGDQDLSAVNIKTPPGFSATLKGIPYCPQTAIESAEVASYSGADELANPSCPAASQVGESVAGAGAGTHPVYLPGKVYLAGPYKGAPLSLAVITPAVSGPYDLGNVVVRAALHVNPETAQVTAVSDPLPQILAGIPLRLRSVLLELNRPDFTLNPTNCDPFAVNAEVSGSEGALASPSAHFQVANCRDLPFAPKLSLKLTGGVNRLGHPAIHALLTTQPGEANPSSIAVTLPPNELLDNAHFNSICTKVAFAARTCPAGSLIGHAEVTSPLLDQPLTGNAYLRSSAKGLPDIALDLYGQFHIEAIAHVDSASGGLRTTFHTVPDVPLGTVKLDLQGASKGLVQNSESLCGHHFKANVVMHGQNGRSLQRSVPLQTACGKAAKHKRHRHRAHHNRRVGR